jgi:transposase
MFAIGAATQIYLATGVTDLRKGFNGLHGLIGSRWQSDPLSGDLYLFCNRRRNALKIFFWSEGAMWVCAARLERGTYRWPKPGEASVTLSVSQLQLLLSGIDLAGATQRNRWKKVQ